jgi:DNA adenine methylase
MFKQVQQGWLPPMECSETEYKYIKSNPDEIPHLTGFVGFACSFAGVWMSTYISIQKDRKTSYCKQGYNAILLQRAKILDINFECNSYEKIEIPLGSMVYCDIPYKGTTAYKFGKFNHDEFYSWVKNNSDKYDIYISEYIESVPPDFTVVWYKESKQEIRNKNGERKSTTECLIKYIPK